MKISNKGLLAILVVALELAFLPILLEIGGSSLGAIQLLVYTFLVGSVASLMLTYVRDRGKGLVKIIKSRKALLITAIAGITNYGIANLLLAVGTLHTNPSLAAVILRSWVLILAILTPLLLRNKINRYQILAICIGIIGIYLLATGGTAVSISASALPYILVLIAAAFATAISNIMIKSYQVSTVDSVALFNIASFAFALALAAIFGVHLGASMSLKVLGVILFLGIVPYTLGSVLFYYSFKTLNSIFVANTTLIIPFLTIPFSYLILGTPIKLYYIYAYALIAVGIVIQQKYSKKAPEYVKSRSSRIKDLQMFDVTGAFVNNKSSSIYRSVMEGKRALAMPIDGASFKAEQHNELFSKYGCTAFTNREPHPDVRVDEIQFINEIIDQKPGEDLLICLGESKNIESAFAEFVRPNGSNEEYFA